LFVFYEARMALIPRVGPCAVLITGRAGAGKDTLGAHLRAAHGFTTHLSFAQSLRALVVNVWNGMAGVLADTPVGHVWPRISVEDCVDQATKELPLTLLDGTPLAHPTRHGAGLTRRALLQFVGTDCGRRHLGENVWIDAALTFAPPPQDVPPMYAFVSAVWNAFAVILAPTPVGGDLWPLVSLDASRGNDAQLTPLTLADGTPLRASPTAVLTPRALVRTLGHNAWLGERVDAVTPATAPRVVVTDARFRNEFVVPRAYFEGAGYKVVTVRVLNPHQPPPPPEGLHPSETDADGVEVDVTLVNEKAAILDQAARERSVALFLEAADAALLRSPSDVAETSSV
jgi:hypothetical protein